jgi:hypothetical protein
VRWFSSFCKSRTGKFSLDDVDSCNILGKYYKSLTSNFTIISLSFFGASDAGLGQTMNAALIWMLSRAPRLGCGSTYAV